MTDVWYYIRDVKTPFSEWVKCSTRLCAAHKKDKISCFIKPETTIHPTGNGLYECDECKENRPRTLNEIYGEPDTRPITEPARLTKDEQEELAAHLAALREHFKE
jgi:hypothetical protein